MPKAKTPKKKPPNSGGSPIREDSTAKTPDPSAAPPCPTSRQTRSETRSAVSSEGQKTQPPAAKAKVNPPLTAGNNRGARREKRSAVASQGKTTQPPPAKKPKNPPPILAAAAAKKEKANKERTKKEKAKKAAKAKQAAKAKSTAGKGAVAKDHSGSGSKVAPALPVYGGHGMADMDDLNPPTELEQAAINKWGFDYRIPREQPFACSEAYDEHGELQR